MPVPRIISNMKGGLARIFSRSSMEETSPKYRVLPLFSGIIIPLSVLLTIPSLTGQWSGQTVAEGGNMASKPNTSLHQTALAISLVCAILANGCLVVRFAERGIKTTTLMSIIFLSLHNIIIIVTVTIFAVENRLKDGLTYGAPFWMTVCSTLISIITNVTLVLDYVLTADFANSGSGLTHKQRSLVIITIILFFYLAIGALIQSYLLKLTFINALYFSVVTIETIGFGDIYPYTMASRIFVVFYVTFGILILAVAVSTTREALLEGVVAYLEHRIHIVKQKQRDRHTRSRWRTAITWRLRAKRLPVWVDIPQGELRSEATQTQRVGGVLKLWRKREGGVTESKTSAHIPGLRHRQLNVAALTTAQLEAAALEAGAPLSDLLPPGLIPCDRDPHTGTLPSPRSKPLPTSIHIQPPPTHVRLGGMTNLLGSFALAAAHGERSSEIEMLRRGMTASKKVALDEPTLARIVENERKVAAHVRLVVALILFLVFWMVGAVIFSETEGWSFGIAFYFCFIAFTTVGYGDLTPRTPAGRSIFVVWALLGVGTMTILFSILSEAYSTRYRHAIHAETYQKVTFDDKDTVDRQQGLGGAPPSSDTLGRTASSPPSTPIRQGETSSLAGSHAVHTTANALNKSRQQQVEAPPATLSLESISRRNPEQFLDSIQNHIQGVRVILQAARASGVRNVSGHTGVSPMVTRDHLQDMLEDIDQRLLDITTLRTKR